MAKRKSKSSTKRRNRGLVFADGSVAKPDRCIYCGRRADHDRKITIDHFIPKALGGLNRWWNRVPACLKCNQEKGASSPSPTHLHKYRIFALKKALYKLHHHQKKRKNQHE